MSSAELLRYAGDSPVNAFTHRIAPVKPFTAAQQARVLRTTGKQMHPFSRIAIEPAESARLAAIKRFGMRKAGI